jgi:hypothetical protein
MTATTRQVSGDRRRETVSLFSPKHYSADNLANECNLASADDRASADDLEIQYHLASADNLEIQYHLASADNLESRHKQTAEQTTKPANPKRLCPREAVKFNAPVHQAAANDFDLTKPRDPRLRWNGWFGVTSRAMVPTNGYRPVSHDAEL